MIYGGLSETNLLFQHIFRILVIRARSDTLVELGDARLLALEFLVVVALLLDQALDGLGCHCERRWGRHFPGEFRSRFCDDGNVELSRLKRGLGCFTW